MQGAPGFGQAEIEQGAEGAAAVGPAQGIVGKADEIENIDILRADIVVAGHQEGLPGSQQFDGTAVQPLHPAQLVIVFLARARIAVRQVKSGDGDAGDIGFDIAGLFVAVVAGQADAHRIGLLQAQQRDAVVALLAMDMHVIAQRLEFQQREVAVLAFDFLQHQHIGPGLAHPVDGIGQPGLDRIDVPGGDAHGRCVRWQRSCRSRSWMRRWGCGCGNRRR